MDGKYTISTSKASFEMETNGGITEVFTVNVDGIEFSSNYELLNDFGWIVPIETESGLKLKINGTRDVPYKVGETEYKERKGYITLVHLLDDKVQTQVEVTQKLNEYKVECEDSEITFESFPKSVEVKELVFTSEGGNKEVLLKGVRQYGKDWKLKVYDNGINVRQVGNKVIVESYGRIFDEGEKYVIVGCHSNKRDVVCEVSVNYK